MKINLFCILFLLIFVSIFAENKIDVKIFEMCTVEKGFSGHASPVFSNEFNEMYWSEYDETQKKMLIKYKIRKDGVWQRPSIAVFSGTFWDDSPCFSPDNRRLYFVSKRPLKNKKKNDMDIWYVNRTQNGWSNPIHLAFNTGLNEGGPSVAANGNLYYSCYYADSKGDLDIYYVELKDGKYGKPINLLKINTKYSEFTPFISKDETFMILSTYNRPEGNGLFISVKDKHGNWKKPAYFDDLINMDSFKRFPSLTPEEKSLIFSAEGRYYQIDFLELKNRLKIN